MPGGTKMSRNQQHSQTLETVTVGPGCETGLYYILVANLSHNTTWKELKAFAAQACEVDHAEVYTPTSGFVRVKGLANFEKAFKHLNGNTLEYRSLQADARNKTHPTVVKLPPNDYHAVRIRRGERGRVFSEPCSPTPTPDPGTQSEQFPQNAGAGMNSPYRDYQGSGSPALNMSPQASTRWGYAASSPYTSSEGYQAAAGVALAGQSSLAYLATADPSCGFSQVATSPQPAISQPMGYPALTTPATESAQYPFGTPAPYYASGFTYGVTAGQGYTGYSDAQLIDKSNCGQFHNPGYGEVWASDAAAQAPAPQPGQVIYDGSERPSVIIELRKIIIHNLERDGLSEACVVGLITEYTGIGRTGSGQIERVEIPINKDGRPRGTAFVTFSCFELANAAIAALDGREVGDKKLSVKMAEGVSDGGSSNRPGRRVAKSSSKQELGGGHRRLAPRSGSQTAGSKAALLMPPATISPASNSAPAGNSSQKKKEDRPVIADGSGGRWKKEEPPIVVDGNRRGHQRESMH